MAWQCNREYLGLSEGGGVLPAATCQWRERDFKASGVVDSRVSVVHCQA
jgi:hypothetical protein